MENLKLWLAVDLPDILKMWAFFLIGTVLCAAWVFSVGYWVALNVYIFTPAEFIWQIPIGSVVALTPVHIWAGITVGAEA